MKKNNNYLFILAIVALAVVGVLFVSGKTGLATANDEKMIIAINDKADEYALMTASDLLMELSSEIKATDEQIKFYSEIYPADATKKELMILLNSDGKEHKALIILDKKASSDYESAAETASELLQYKGYNIQTKLHTDITLQDLADIN